MDVNDTIPLHEIDEVVEMDDECETTHKHHSLGSKSNSLSKDNALQKEKQRKSDDEKWNSGICDRLLV